MKVVIDNSFKDFVIANNEIAAYHQVNKHEVLTSSLYTDTKVANCGKVNFTTIKSEPVRKKIRKLMTVLFFFKTKSMAKISTNQMLTKIKMAAAMNRHYCITGSAARY